MMINNKPLGWAPLVLVRLLTITSVLAIFVSYQAKAQTQFYPLRVGNSWKYCSSSSVANCVTWTVENAQRSKGGDAFTIISQPTSDDDNLMVVQAQGDSLKELASGHRLLVDHKPVGFKWSYSVWNARKHQAYVDTFEIVARGSCGARLQRFATCLSVKETDPSINIVQVTTYAYGVGPVQYEYFRIGERVAFSVLSLVDWKLSS